MRAPLLWITHAGDDLLTGCCDQQLSFLPNNKFTAAAINCPIGRID